MAEVSQNTKYVKLDDGVSFGLVRTNPKLTTNTKLMYNGKKMYMESYASGELLNRATYKNVSVSQSSTYNKDISNFLLGSGTQAYSVYQNFSDTTISDSYDNQYERMYWCGAECIESSFYDEEIGFVAPLYLREKLPNYFLIFRLDSPSNYNFTIDEYGKIKDTTFDFTKDILDKAVLIKTFDLREGSVLGNYIHNYINQEGFEFDKSMYVNFSTGEVTYYGIDRLNGVLESRVDNFENELLKNDNPILKDDKWFTEGFERNGLIFPYIMNIEYLFDDDNFIHNGVESYDFARYIGVYCNNIEFGEFVDLDELSISGYTERNAIYYFEDNNKNLHRYSNDENGFKVDGKDSKEFDIKLITGFEGERITGYAEPLETYDGFINRAQYGFEILKPFEPGDWVGIEYNGHVECYFADNKNISAGEKNDILIGDYSDFRFYVDANSSANDVADALVKSINRNKRSKFEAKCSDNVVAFYAKKEGKEFNGSETGGAKMLIEASLLYNKKISLPISNNIKYVSGGDCPIEDISDSDYVLHASEFDENGNFIRYDKSSFGDYYKDYFCGSCDVEINTRLEIYKNVFRIYADDYGIFDVNRYLKTKNGEGRRICANMVYIDAEGKVDYRYRIVLVDDAPFGKNSDNGYDVSVSSTNQVEIMDPLKVNHGILSWFPVRDFDFDINYSTYGQYGAFVDECNKLSRKIKYTQFYNLVDTADSDSMSTQDEAIYGIKELAESPFFDDYGNSLDSEYDYFLEQIHPELCIMSKSVPYISKWGYYDEQKDSCENPYRLNVSKVFGVSNLSANTYLRDCNINEYTHSMPYYMTLDLPNYLKEYQYILTDEIYKTHIDKNEDVGGSDSDIDTVQFNEYFKTFYDCVDYWINKVFMRTDMDMFSQFFSGKKYGKRFDKKYSRLLGGDKFHNPSTLFRGVKFEAVRQYIGVDKRTNEYNGYKFSFVFIPVMLDSMIFSSTVHFVKNDTFRFIVGIIFVNTMLGVYDHNIFNGDIDYFKKGYIYAASKDIIRPENISDYHYNLTLSYESNNSVIKIEDIYNDIWRDNYNINKIDNTFHMWIDMDNQTIIVTKLRNIKEDFNIIGVFDIDNSSEVGEGIENITNNLTQYTLMEEIESDNKFKILYERYYELFDTTIYRCADIKYYGSIKCEMSAPVIELKNNVITEICDIDWRYYDEKYSMGYIVDIGKLHFKSESIQNILFNLGVSDSIERIRVYNVDNPNFENGIGFEKTFEKNNATITVDINSGDITITPLRNKYDTIIEMMGYHGENILNLRMDITIKDRFDINLESVGLRSYFSPFNQLSMYNITTNVNNDYNVNYYSTNEDNKYKIRIIEPDSIEIEDKYEATPVKVTRNNKVAVGSMEITEKSNVDNIGIKVINRYSGYYNPIFKDVLYYGDYTYTKSVGRLKNVEKFEMPYSNTYIDHTYSDNYGEFGVIKNMCYHKTNVLYSDRILTFENPVYPAINEYALDYKDYNIFSSSWDKGYFVSQDDLNTRSLCDGIGSMKDGMCMFGSKYLNLPDDIFIDTFDNVQIWDEKMTTGLKDNTEVEIMHKEINDKTVKYQLFIEKRLKRYLKEKLIGVFSKYIHKIYSFGNKGTIEDDVEEYVEKNILRLYAVDKVYMYIKSEPMKINDKLIENEYVKFVNMNNELKIKNGFPIVFKNNATMLKDNPFSMTKINEFDRIITYNLKPGFKESFGFAVSFRRK